MFSCFIIYLFSYLIKKWTPLVIENNAYVDNTANIAIASEQVFCLQYRLL